MTAWAVLWRSASRATGRREHLIWSPAGGPYALFRTRAECRRFIEQEWGYIRERADLRAEPHGWRMPIPVRVRVVVDA